MGQFSLKRLLGSTAIVAVGFLPWRLASPDIPAVAFLGFPLVGAGIGDLFNKPGLGAIIGLAVGLTAATFAIERKLTI
jgi:hypothetical protein